MTYGDGDVTRYYYDNDRGQLSQTVMMVAGLESYTVSQTYDTLTPWPWPPTTCTRSRLPRAAWIC